MEHVSDHKQLLTPLIEGFGDAQTKPTCREVVPRKLRTLSEESFSELSLPQIVGVTHSEDKAHLAVELVKSLPSNSKVGIELCPPESYPHMSESSTLNWYFKTVAQVASEYGHKLVYLERRMSEAGPLGRQIVETVNSLENLEKKSFFKKFITFPKALLLSSKRFMKLLNPYIADEIFNRSAWRSMLMIRSTLRESWKSTDVVIVGKAHARQISHALKTDSYQLLKDSPLKNSPEAQEDTFEAELAGIIVKEYFAGEKMPNFLKLRKQLIESDLSP